MDELQTRLLNHLLFLYGVGSAEDLCRRIQVLMRHYPLPPPIEDLKTSTGLTERDALLITYGDQVTEPGIAPLVTLADFLRRQCSGVVSGIHLLPFYPYTSDDGFAVTDFFAVNPDWGTWDDITQIGKTFDLMFDGVFNHLSAQSVWFRHFLNEDPRYHDFFITVEGKPDLSQVIRPRTLPLLTPFPTLHGSKQIWTTFSDDQVDLNYKNPEVLLAVLDALLFYVAQGTRFIRLDAIAFLWKEAGTTCLHLPQTHRVVQLFRTVLDQVAPPVLLITETNVPHADNLSYFGSGMDEAQLIYNFALPPLVMHTLRVGQATQLSAWAASLSLPSTRTAFLNFLASHDGIGLNPVRGILSLEEIQALVEQTLAHGGLVSYKQNPDGTQSPYELNITYFDALSDPNAAESLRLQIDRFFVAQAIMLALAGVPAIYFHSLFGSRNDRAAALASQMPRRINRQRLSRRELTATLADPQSLRAQVFARYQALLRVRQAHPAFHPHSLQQIISPSDNRMFALLRVSPNQTDHVLCVHNVSSSMVSVILPLPEPYAQATWRNLLAPENCVTSAHQSLAIKLNPYTIAWLGRLDAPSSW